MPDTFGSSGFRGSRRRRRDETAPPSDLAPYWPSPEEQRLGVERDREASVPLWANALSAQSNIVPMVVGGILGAPLGPLGVAGGAALGGLVGGSAIPTAIEGGKREGAAGAISGLWRGSPLAATVDALGIDQFAYDPKTFSDIRRAFGDQSDQEGLGQFSVNLAGDVLLDPTTWINPFGAVSKAASTSAAAFRGMSMVKQVQAGIRAPVVFHVPFTSLYANPLGVDQFKSFNIQAAKAVDWLFGSLRVNPITGPILQKMGAVGLKDADQAGIIQEARNIGVRAGESIIAGAMMNLQKIDPAIKRLMLERPEAAQVFSDLIEIGVEKLDDRGSILNLYKNWDDIAKERHYARMYADNAGFRDLWKRAANGDDTATKALYEGFDIKLPRELLDRAGLTPRYGIDTMQPETVATVTGTFGTPSAGEAARIADTAAGRPLERAVWKRLRDERAAEFEKVWKDIENGTISKKGVEDMLAVHRDMMGDMATVGMASGLVNGLTINYLPHIRNPALQGALENQASAALRRLGFSADASFMKQRKFIGKTAAEVNAFLEEVGSKATAFQAVGDLKKRFETHGAWAVLDAMFPKKWVEKLARSTDEEGLELANWFLTNPVHADLFYAQRFAGALRGVTYWNHLAQEGSPVVYGSAKLADTAAVTSLAQDSARKGWKLVMLSGRSHVARETGDVLTEAIGRDVQTRLRVHRYKMAEDLGAELQREGDRWDSLVTRRQDLLNLSEGGDLTWTNATPYYEMTLKKSLRDAGNARAMLRELRGDLSDAKRTGQGASAVEAIKAQIANQEAVLARADMTRSGITEAIKEQIDDMLASRNEVLSGIESKGTSNIARVKEFAEKGVTAEVISNEIKLWHRMKEQGHLVWNELSPEMQQRLQKSGKQGRLVAMDPEAYAAAVKFEQEFNKPDLLRHNRMVQALDGLKNWFVNMTVLHPANVQTRMRDVGGGQLTLIGSGNWHVGGPIAAGRATAAIQRAARKGVAVGDELAGLPKVGVYDMAEVEMKMQSSGLIGVGSINDALQDTYAQAMTAVGGSKAKTVMSWVAGAIGVGNVKENPVFRVGQKMARYGDDYTKRTAVYSAILNGQTLEEAIHTAKRWTYGTGADITSFERYGLRRFIPFFGFQKWAMQRSAELWLTKPGSMAWMSKARDNAVKANGLNDQELKEFMPEFMRDGLGIPVRNTPDGPVMYMFGQLFPIGSAMEMVNAVSKVFGPEPVEAFRYIGMNMHPALKNLGEIAANRDFFTGRELATPGQRTEMLGVDMDKRVAHVVKSWFRGLAALDQMNVFNAVEMKVMVDAVKRGSIHGERNQLPFIERMLSSAFGPNPARGYLLDIEHASLATRRKHEQSMSQKKWLLRRAAASGKAAEVETIQPLIADELAKIMARRAGEAAYGVSPLRPKKQILAPISLENQ